MPFAALLLAARSVPRRLVVQGAVLALLIGLTGGLATAAWATATDTANAYDRLITATDGFDAAFDGPARQVAAVNADPRVSDVGLATIVEIAAYTTGSGAGALGPEPDNACFTGAGDVAGLRVGDGWRGRAPTYLIGSGRMPRARALEIVLPRITADRAELQVGERVEIRGTCNGDAEEQPIESPLVVSVSGIGTTILDASLIGANFGIEGIGLSERVADELHQRGAPGRELNLVWLEPGRSSADVPPLADVSENSLDVGGLAERTRDDLRPDGLALRVGALVVLVSALVILGPVLGRQIRSSSATNPTLRAVGMGRGALWSVAIIRGLVIAAAAGTVAAVSSVGLARLLPLGSAQRFAGALPFGPDGLAAISGGVAVGALTLGVAAVVGGLVARTTRPRSAPSSRLVRRFEALGLRPETLAGARFALEPGSRSDPAPVRSGLTTVALALAVVMGVTTFSNSVEHLRTTPRLYGWNWDAFTISEQAQAMADRLDADPQVDQVGFGTFFPDQVALGDEREEIWMMSFEAGPDRIGPTVIRGQAPRGPRDILVSPELARRLDVHINDQVELHVLEPGAGLAGELGVEWAGPDERAVALEVVGIGVLPIGDGRVGIGTAMTFEGLAALHAGGLSEEFRSLVASVPRQKLEPSLQYLGLSPDELAHASSDELAEMLLPSPDAQMVLVRARTPRLAAERLIAASGGELSARDFEGEITPETIISLDLSQSSHIPELFSRLMAVIAVTMVLLLILTGGQHRRRELTLLRALGCSRRQVRRAILVQAAVTVGVAALLAPVGIAVGRLAWRAYSTRLGVLPVVSVPIREAVVAVLALLVIALMAGFVAGAFEGRRSLARAMRPAE